jgi:dynein heavy chain, axonemal
MIWSLSKFYNTEDRLTGLLRKISNEIIRRCCSAIDLTAVFSGDVDNAMAVLHQSRECAVQWKGVYRATAKLIAAATPDTSRHWYVVYGMFKSYCL